MKIQTSDTNTKLNQHPNWKGTICVRCGRSYPETTLDLLRIIQSGGAAICLDLKSCKEVSSKQKKPRKVR